MKKILSIVLVVLITIISSVQSNAQTLKFLGIPVDGRKSEVIALLKNKGFVYDSVNDCLSGKFNGVDSHIFVSENHGKVDRIMVAENTLVDEAQIIIHFNNLLYSFQNNEKYIGLSENQEISSNEDISYEMLVHNKVYTAHFILKRNEPGFVTELVWFTIARYGSKYFICIYYDNLMNRPNGQDL